MTTRGKKRQIAKRRCEKAREEKRQISTVDERTKKNTSETGNFLLSNKRPQTLSAPFFEARFLAFFFVDERGEDARGVLRQGHPIGRKM